MLFNSSEFLLFLPIVFGLYWFIVQRNLKAQNMLLVLASYVFYGWWDWRFLGLIAFSTVVDYLVGLQIAEAQEKRAKKQWLAVSLVVNLGLLSFFKYSNFFIDSWIDAWANAGVTMHISSLKVILPVGISFYTFQTLSYSIDIYRGTLKPTRSFINFAAFVSFFPQLVAGPIERASRLLPQIENRREFKYEEGVAGLRLILWGMFKKVVVADTCAIYANDIFANYTDYSGPTLMLGAVYFAFQIYGDFSGYSDIAIGTAKLFGIQLMTNFKTPYFSRDIAEFWRRWHISLSTWFRDYLYIPLGGSRAGKWKSVRNVFVIFLVSGFWHGANWTFIAWGGIHAALFLPLLLRGKNRRYTSDTIGEGRWLPNVREFLGMAWTFTMVCVSWVFFRAASVSEATHYISHALNPESLFSAPQKVSYTACVYILALIVGDWMVKNGSMPRRWNSPAFIPVRWGMASIGIWFVLKNFASQANFIYFQF